MRKKYQKWLGLAAVFALLLSAALSLTSSAFYYSGYVNSFLGITGETIERGNQLLSLRLRAAERGKRRPAYCG